jgi:hypothetical protein
MFLSITQEVLIMSVVVNGVKLSDRTFVYLETALWSSTVMLPCTEDDLVDDCMDVDEDHPLHGIKDSSPLDDYFGVEDCDADLLREAEEDCDDFFELIEEAGLYDRALEYTDDNHIAYDFWLTRNGHGAGFWDGDYGDKLGRELTDACAGWGGVDLCVGENGFVGS